MKALRITFLLFFCAITAGCAHTNIAGGAFVSEKYSFSVELPGPPFERISAGGVVAAVTDRTTGASISVSTSPDDYSNLEPASAALSYIARGLFYFVEKKEYRVSEEAVLGGVPAWHLVLAGNEAGTPMVFSAYVARVKDVVYDLVFWCHPDDYEKMVVIFEKTATSFKFLSGTSQ